VAQPRSIKGKSGTKGTERAVRRVRHDFPTGERAIQPKPQNALAAQVAITSVPDNDTRALNALKALCASPSAWGGVKVPWRCRQQPPDFVVNILILKPKVVLGLP
jgi:hypothetical protein